MRLFGRQAIWLSFGPWIALAACGGEDREPPQPAVIPPASSDAQHAARPDVTGERASYERDSFRPAQAVWSLDDIPDWYAGTLGPWKNLSEETRKELWDKRRAYEATMTEAMKPSTANSSAAEAAKGQQVLHRVVRDYNLDPFFREADTFGRRMVIWLPEAAWARLSPEDKAALEAYMASKYANWGIGVGRQRGREVLYDRLVVER